MADAIILGSGPAGISAALYLQRAGLKATVVGMGLGSLAKAEKIENYYGLETQLTGEQLHLTGIKQAKALGAEVVEDEIVALKLGATEGFMLVGKKAQYEGNAILFATGAARIAPPIAGLKDFEGRGVSYCATCDGFFYKGKEVAVLGAGEYALHEAGELSHLASKVTLLTNGAALEGTLPAGMSLDSRKVMKVEGGDTVEKIAFDQGEPLPISGFFVAMGNASAASLAKTFGIEADERYIKVDENMQTNVPGVFAAGDCTGGLMQMSKAVGQGAIAGTAMVKHLRAHKT